MPGGTGTCRHRRCDAVASLLISLRLRTRLAVVAGGGLGALMRGARPVQSACRISEGAPVVNPKRSWTQRRGSSDGNEAAQGFTSEGDAAISDWLDRWSSYVRHTRLHDAQNPSDGRPAVSLGRGSAAQ
jgi:hypothetical protein